MFKNLIILTVALFTFNAVAADMIANTVDTFSGTITTYSDGSTAHTVDTFGGAITTFSDGSTAHTIDTFGGTTTYFNFND